MFVDVIVPVHDPVEPVCDQEIDVDEVTLMLPVAATTSAEGDVTATFPVRLGLFAVFRVMVLPDAGMVAAKVPPLAGVVIVPLRFPVIVPAVWLEKATVPVKLAGFAV